MVKECEETGLEVAIIGMAGRFPGANSIEEFWENLKKGIEAISFFSPGELEGTGIAPETYNSPIYVGAKGILEGAEYFDPAFFGYTVEEAELMDPQMRILHESVWAALEDAGYNPYQYDGLIGVYVGSTGNAVWESVILLSASENVSESFLMGILANKDYISTKISYNLNLKGPSTTLFNACSTSLVASHFAYSGLLNGECDIALTGGISISLPLISGYMWQEGMVYSKDGHCRAFDKDASGTPFSNGAGIVVLKRYKDAIADNDHIYAVIKGSAINNDGNRKIGFTAPSVEGQAEVIETALQMAEVEYESIGYIETHGTGTALGDPIEIRALKNVFAARKKGTCAIGSVKSNIGHLDAAAGIAGLIKTALALTYKTIPPSLHFEKLNPQIRDFENSPFYVNTTLSQWKGDQYPLRAAISSFGVGGTNVHMILEESPPICSTIEQPVSRHSFVGPVYEPYQLILLSAKTTSTLEQMTSNLVGYFKKNPRINLADTAFTLQVGRKPFNHRRMAVCSNTTEAIKALEQPKPGNTRVFSAKKNVEASVVFMFSGQGSQYKNMGLELYRTLPAFREEMDHCITILESIMGPVRHIIYPNPENTEDNGNINGNINGRNSKDKINQVIYSGPIKFIFDYSMAKLLMKWGIKPRIMIGHSFGEYVSACLSGVFSLEDALKIVVLRGQLFEQLPEGAMLSVPLSGEELESYLNPQSELSLAAVNTPSISIVSGPRASIDSLNEKLKKEGCECLLINFPGASHSKMVEPILPEFQEHVSRITLNKPGIPYITCVTGKRMTPEDAVDPDYYTRHLRQTVRFADGIGELINENHSVFIQVGAGNELTLFVRQHPGMTPHHLVLNLLKKRNDDISDLQYLLERVGDLWLAGQNIDWHAFHQQGEKRHRIPLPTYPFERQRYWKYVGNFAKRSGKRHLRSQLKKKKNISQWFYLPSWERSILQPVTSADNNNIPPSRSCCLIFMDSCAVGSQLAKRLKQHDKNLTVIRVKQGSGFEKISNHRFVINPGSGNDYVRLLDELEKMGKIPDRILHLWGLTKKKKNNQDRKLNIPGIRKTMYLGFYSLLHLAKSIGNLNYKNEIRIEVVTHSMQEVDGEEIINPGESTVLGPVKVIPQEYPDIICRSIDVILPEPGPLYEIQKNRLIDQLLAEFTAVPLETVTAYRGKHRWVQSFKPVRLPESPEGKVPLKEGGIYLITGGTGRIGLILAEYLVKNFHVCLILTGRSQFPGRKQWEKWLSTHDESSRISRKIRKLKKLEEMGARLLVCRADAANKDSMKKVIQQAEKKFGPINGVIHSAGMLNAKSFQLIEKIGESDCEQLFRSKIDALLVLETIFKNKSLDFCILMSSLASVLGGLGHVVYSAANIFMDHFVFRHNQENSVPWISINWEEWNIPVEGQKSQKPTTSVGATLAELAITPEEGIDVFNRILSWGGAHRILTSSGDINVRIEKWIKLKSIRKDEDSDKEEPQVNTSLPRPELSTPYVPPSGPVEKEIEKIWKNLFGFEKLGAQDDFFELGGDSLKAMVVTYEIHKKLKVRIPITQYFSQPTIESIAKYIEQNNKKSEISIIHPAEKKEYYPASSTQRRIYLIQEMDPQGIAYNEFNVFTIRGNPDRVETIAEEIFKKLIMRHESLRTSFFMPENEILQQVWEPDTVEFSIEYHDVAAEDTIYHFVRAFDLSRPLLIRVGLIKAGENKLILMIDIHHIITDGISLGILLKDFTRLFQGEELAPLRIQYKDFSQWQNQEIEKEKIKKQGEYWLKEFAGHLPVLKLPVDHPESAQQDFEGSREEFMLGKEESGALRQMAGNERTPLFMVCLAIFNVFLSKISNQADILIGTPISLHERTELKQVIGMFVNTLVLRNFPEGKKTFIQFLAEVKKRTLEALDNKDYPFDELVDKVVVNRDSNRNPIFDVMFSSQNLALQTNTNRDHREISKKPGPQKAKETGFIAKQAPYGNKITKLDMILFFKEIGTSLHFTLQYRIQLFKKETILRFIEYFKEITTQIIKNHHIKLKDISISHDLFEGKSDVKENEYKEFRF